MPNETNTYKKLKDKPKDNFPEFIVVHHSNGIQADPRADTSHHTASGMEAQHISMGWEGLGYHYVIHNNGDIWLGRPEQYHGAHTAELDINKKSIAICLAGNFDVYMPTKEQISALITLMKDVKSRYNVPLVKIVPHRHFLGTPPYKSCFGNNLAEDWAQKLLETPPTVPVIIKSKETILKRVDALSQEIGKLRQDIVDY